VKHEHCLNQSGGTFKMSSYLQEMVCYVGQNEVFEEGETTLKKLRGIEIPAKQIERVSHFYGEKLEETLNEAIETGAPNLKIKDNEVLHYAMLDGSMLLTREEGWKEIKLGRIFKGTDNITISKDRKIITNSLYVSHLGGHKEFTDKIEYYLDSMKNIVLIADGAKWIWNWASATYPEMVQILDFYHAKEHICNFAKNYFREQIKVDTWVEQQCQLLLNDEVLLVIKNINELPDNTKTKAERDSLIKYYKTNINRMMYKTFLDKEFLIGSGAIESAHRHVLQKRLKLSGQRWTFNGLQQVANLRVAYKSGQWAEVIDLTKKAA
jgi:hypothetical protein